MGEVMVLLLDDIATYLRRLGLGTLGGDIFHGLHA
jgi:hypothetical protein